MHPLAVVFLVALVMAGAYFYLTGRLDRLIHGEDAPPSVVKITPRPPDAEATVAELFPPKAVTPKEAWDAYQAAGGYARWKGDPYFTGQLDAYEIAWLRGLTQAERTQWAQDFRALGPQGMSGESDEAGIFLTSHEYAYHLQF